MMTNQDRRALTAFMLALLAALMLSCGPRYIQTTTTVHDTVSVSGFNINEHRPAPEIDQELIDSLMRDCDDLRRALEYDLRIANESLDEYRNKPPVRGQDLIKTKNTGKTTGEVKKVAQRLRNTACPADSILKEFTQIICVDGRYEKSIIKGIAKHDSSGLSLILMGDTVKVAYDKEINDFNPVKNCIPWWMWTAFGIGLAFAFFIGYKTGR